MGNLDTYSHRFYQNQLIQSKKSAKLILPIIDTWFRPKSVIDIGCGIGAWLYTWKEHNKSIEIKGLDANFVEKSIMLIDVEKEFVEVDLNKSLPKLKKYDLAMSLEVAEHLEERRADSFVKDLTELSDVIIFSAAIPGQEGTHHINEQFLRYWIDKFDQNNYKCYDIIRPIIWDNDEITWWFRQNIVLFVNDSHKTKIDLSAFKSYDGFDFVQKELFNHKIKTQKRLENEVSHSLNFKTLLKKIIRKFK